MIRFVQTISRFWLAISGIISLPVVGLAQPTAMDSTKRTVWKLDTAKPIRIYRNINYGDASEPMHRADVYVPRNDPSQPIASLPTVLMIHGGAWSLGDKTNDAVHARRLAGRGYVVVAINYRLAPAHPFPAQWLDCKRALQWLASDTHSFPIDRQRVGLWGYSAGGHLAALMTLRPDPDTVPIRASVFGGTPFDLTTIPPKVQILTGVFGGTYEEKPDTYRDASPIFHLTPKAPPLFLFHGTADIIVPFQSSERMVDALRSQSMEHEFVVSPDKGHLATFVDSSAIDGSFDFLDRHLQPTKSP
jgi:acetyl esterase/lipase